ncbi:type III pantothenate kinase [Bacteroidota bacterium]
MKLILDFGNTLQKVALFQEKKLIHQETFKNISLQNIIDIIYNYPTVQSAILSSVIDYPSEINDYLKSYFYFIELSHHTPVPVINKYQSPETLGKDRIAAVVAANNMYHSKNVLVIDAGSCITYDMINSKNEYLGGSISPGIDMRFRSLHNFTDKLPLVNSREPISLTGVSTQEAILSGVLNGVCEEMRGIIHNYNEKYHDLITILSGGDMIYFDKCLKNNIFAVSNIVIAGLNIILDFNVKE